MTQLAKQVITDLEASRDVFTRAIADTQFVEAVTRAASMIADAVKTGHKVLFAGNGGSAADAQHLATELVVRFKTNRPAIPALALTTDTSLLTAVGNDLGFDQLFARQIEALGQNGDVFVGISTSGRSPNVLVACRAARKRGLAVVGLTGAKGGLMAECCDVLVRVPSEDTPLIQQVHIAAGHTICAFAEKHFLPG